MTLIIYACSLQVDLGGGECFINPHGVVENGVRQRWPRERCSVLLMYLLHVQKQLIVICDDSAAARALHYMNPVTTSWLLESISNFQPLLPLHRYPKLLATRADP